MDSKTIIQKKRSRESLNEEEIRYFVSKLTKEEITEGQAAALLSYIYVNGMNEDELVYLSKAMADSGEKLDLADIAENLVNIIEENSMLNWRIVTACQDKYSHKEKTEIAKRSRHGNLAILRLDVTNLKGNLNNNTLTLTWNSVAKQKDCEEGWGQIAYRIYSADKDQLALVKTTTSTNASLTVTSKSPNKYIVKTIYEAYAGNMSSGAEITVALPKDDKIEIALKGQYSMTVTVNSTFTDPGYSVKEGKTDVTAKAKVTKKITDAATNKTVEKIDTSKVGSYKITYVIKYEDTSKTLTRNITVAPKSNTTTDKEQEQNNNKEEESKNEQE